MPLYEVTTTITTTDRYLVAALSRQEAAEAIELGELAPVHHEVEDWIKIKRLPKVKT